MSPRKIDKRDGFPVVGIGGSAGGLEATQELLEKIPPDIGMAFVVVHHLAEKTRSYLPEILGRATAIPVVTVTDQMPIEPNHVYVMPGTADVEIKQEHLFLVPRTPAASHLPIDHFFGKLAESRGANAVGVVLSGTGSDGSKGLQEIRAHGGTTFVQDLQSAKYEDMPRHALESGQIDFVLSPSEMANELVRLSRSGEPADKVEAPLRPARPAKVTRPAEEGGEAEAHSEPGRVAEAEPPVAKAGGIEARARRAIEVTPVAAELPVPGEDEEEKLARVFRILRQKTGVDFSRYKRPTLLRRMGRRMQLLHIDHLDDYIARLQREPEEVQKLFGDLLISVTEFFRDPATFDYLKSDIFPRLVAEKAGREVLRIWVAGVATGEEAYSLAITLLEAAGERFRIRAQIFATDVSDENLQRAREGIYTTDIESEVSPARLQRFFERTDGGYRVSKRVRELCVFARHNVVSDPPFSKLDLISCRNLMIYFDPLLQERVAKIFHYALSPGGLLLLGRSENLSGKAAAFELVDRTHHLYTKVGASAELPALSFPLGRPEHMTAAAMVANPAVHVALDAFDPRREAERILAAAYAPASVLVSDSFEILSFQGKTGAYLEPAEGRASFDLLGMAREGLGPSLRRALEKAKETMAKVEAENVRFNQGTRMVSVDLEVRPFRASDQRRYYIIIFRDHKGTPKSRAKSSDKPAPTKDELDMVREELEFSRARLESVIQEKETGLEEVRAAYEEIQSSNEELQSTNEELETAKEELESINEELTTVNDQLDRRNHELSEAHDFIANLLASIEIPIVVVDSDLRIRRFEGAKALFNLREQDIGRRLTELALQVDVSNLPDLIRQVIDHLVPVRREVQDKSGHWYSMMIRPYRTADDRIEGAVLSFLDIDELVRTRSGDGGRRVRRVGSKPKGSRRGQEQGS